MNPANHVAIIMDGNGRWALKRGKSRNYGHQQGLKTIEKIVNYSIKKVDDKASQKEKEIMTV